MNIKKVVVIGSIPLATKVIRYLCSHKLANVIGVICEPESIDYKHSYFQEPCVYDLTQDLGLSAFTFEQIEQRYGDGGLDMGFSCRAPYILHPSFLKCFRKGIVNFHGGPLPEFRGVHIANHVIISGCKRSGATLHYMDEGIDTGPIIAKEYFPIEPHDTAFSVFHRTQQSLWSLFEENIDAMLEDREEPIPQQVFIDQGQRVQYFNRHSLAPLKVLEKSMTLTEIYRRVRGCDFPGHEPAYFSFKGNKIYLTTQDFFKTHQVEG